MGCEIALIILMDLVVGLIEFAPAFEFDCQIDELLELGVYRAIPQCHFRVLALLLPDLVHCHIHESDFQIENCLDESL
jgi:hypothetical protein